LHSGAETSNVAEYHFWANLVPSSPPFRRNCSFYRISRGCPDIRGRLIVGATCQLFPLFSHKFFPWPEFPSPHPFYLVGHTCNGNAQPRVCRQRGTTVDSPQIGPLNGALPQSEGHRGAVTLPNFFPDTGQLNRARSLSGSGDVRFQDSQLYYS
jgi:hypothetical protein